MDFARKQLEKYGWSDGKGLGKHENGISEALKPKLKRSVAGIGYDAAADFTEHWWSSLYDKAAGNVQVEEENGKTKKMKRKENKEFEITNSTWRLKKKDNGKNSEEYSDFFVRTAVLGSGGSKTTKVRDSSDSEEETSKDVVKMTDEELFAACEGRTAHKGARHGLRALGKLARIEQQEQLLLQQAKYNNFLAKSKNNEQIVEDTSLEDVQINKKKKKKKKCCNSNDNNDNMINENTFNESNENCETFNKNEDKVVTNEENTQTDNCSDDVQISKKKKRKKKRDNSNENEYNDNVTNKNTSNECNENGQTSSKTEDLVDNEENIKKKSKKSKRKDNEDSNEFISNTDVSNESENVLKPKKKRKHINIDINEDSKSETQLQAEESSKSKKKNKK